uniref:Uncharacterized protein n=1 Tax=Agrobacterium tumefaciens TaxID=358 RepID=K7XK19_AGRTU|nr:Hypothetical protein [Agrobacterium radiobacter]
MRANRGEMGDDGDQLRPALVPVSFIVINKAGLMETAAPR